MIAARFVHVILIIRGFWRQELIENVFVILSNILHSKFLQRMRQMPADSKGPAAFFRHSELTNLVELWEL